MGGTTHKLRPSPYLLQVTSWTLFFPVRNYPPHTFHSERTPERHNLTFGNRSRLDHMLYLGLTPKFWLDTSNLILAMKVESRGEWWKAERALGASFQWGIGTWCWEHPHVGKLCIWSSQQMSTPDGPSKQSEDANCPGTWPSKLAWGSVASLHLRITWFKPRSSL